MIEKKKLPPQAWKKGQSGNAKGKPRGATNHATRLVMGLMESGAAQVAQVIIEAAKVGDMAAAKMVLERLAPPMRERPINVTLPNTSTAQGCADAANVVLQAVGSGDLLPGEGVALAGIVENRRRSIETLELEQRISRLEQKK